MRRRGHTLAGGLTLLGVALAVATVIFTLADRTAGAPSVALNVLFLALPLAFLGVGGLLATRRPENPVGWLCLASGLLWSIESGGYAFARWAGHDGMIGIATWIGLLGSLWLPAIGLTGTHLALRLPSGSLLSPGWRWYSRFCTVVIVLTGALVATKPGRVGELQGTKNPIALEWLQALSPLSVLLPLSVLGAIGSLVLRYRHAGGIERLQLRWIAFGAVVFLTALLAGVLPLILGLASENSWPPVWMIGVIYLALTAIPGAIGIAVLRYRLYDIDVVINRALVYGALSVLLASTYVVSVLLLQVLLSAVTADNAVAVAGSTLAVAGLVRPGRRRIQSAVDRRFYRQKYDAQRTLEGFATRLRVEVDLDALGDDLRAAVADTMQPAHVSLWLREQEAR